MTSTLPTPARTSSDGAGGRDALRRRSTGRRWRAAAAMTAVVLVPLAFAGLVIGALGDSEDGLKRIPAAVVNSDELINQTAEDGTVTPVFAGRQLVTELTGPDNAGFDWTITNAADAKQALADGDVFAVLTVPKDFSASILSLQSGDPVRADISITTDDAHGYLAGVVAQTVGSGMTTAFGSAITQQYLTGVYGSISDLGAALGTASDGAGQLATGATDLGTGLDSLADGAASAQSGAATLSSGISTYTGGVTSLSTGLGQLDSGAGALSGISTGLDTYTSGVSQLSAAISQATAALTDADLTNDPIAVGTLAVLSERLAEAADGGATLSGQAAGGISGIQSAIGQSAAGAAQLAAGAGPLTSGSASLADGLGSLTSGARDAAGGADQLASGATDLASGLRTGADQVPTMTEDETATAAEVASAPVGFTLDRENEVSGIAPVIATLFVPLGLWIGALAIFLVLRPLTASALASTARTGRVALATIGTAAAAAITQAVVLVALLHVALGVEWSLLPATLGFSVLMALAFTAFHYLLTVRLGRAGLVISLLLLAIQITSTGGPYPIELLSGPFQVISPLLPLTYGVSGTQAIVLGGAASEGVTAALALAGFGLISLLLGLALLGGVRRAVALGLLDPRPVATA